MSLYYNNMASGVSTLYMSSLGGGGPEGQPKTHSTTRPDPRSVDVVARKLLPPTLVDLATGKENRRWIEKEVWRDIASELNPFPVGEDGHRHFDKDNFTRLGVLTGSLAAILACNFLPKADGGVNPVDRDSDSDDGSAVTCSALKTLVDAAPSIDLAVSASALMLNSSEELRRQVSCFMPENTSTNPPTLEVRGVAQVSSVIGDEIVELSWQQNSNYPEVSLFAVPISSASNDGEEIVMMEYVKASETTSWKDIGQSGILVAGLERVSIDSASGQLITDEGAALLARMDDNGKLEFSVLFSGAVEEIVIGDEEQLSVLPGLEGLINKARLAFDTDVNQTIVYGDGLIGKSPIGEITGLIQQREPSLETVALVQEESAKLLEGVSADSIDVYMYELHNSHENVTAEMILIASPDGDMYVAWDMDDQGIKHLPEGGVLNELDKLIVVEELDQDGQLIRTHIGVESPLEDGGMQLPALFVIEYTEDGEPSIFFQPPFILDSGDASFKLEGTAKDAMMVAFDKRASTEMGPPENIGDYVKSNVSTVNESLIIYRDADGNAVQTYNIETGEIKLMEESGIIEFDQTDGGKFEMLRFMSAQEAVDYILENGGVTWIPREQYQSYMSNFTASYNQEDWDRVENSKKIIGYSYNSSSGYGPGTDEFFTPVFIGGFESFFATGSMFSYKNADGRLRDLFFNMSVDNLKGEMLNVVVE